MERHTTVRRAQSAYDPPRNMEMHAMALDATAPSDKRPTAPSNKLPREDHQASGQHVMLDGCPVSPPW